MLGVDVFMAFFIGFVCFGSHYASEGFVAGSAAALILFLSQKLKYVGTALVTLQGAVMSIVLATELVSPQVHKSIYTWVAALVLFISYMLMNHEVFEDNIDDAVDIADFIGTIIAVITFPFRLIGSILKHIINAIKKCFIQIAQLFVTIRKLLHGNAKKEDSTQDHHEQAKTDNNHANYEQQRQEQEERYRRERARREQAAREQRNSSNISYFQNCSSRSELTKAYRKCVKELHPNNGGNPEDFIRMSNEYDRLKTRYAC